MPAGDGQVLIVHADGKLLEESGATENGSTLWCRERLNEVAGPPILSAGDLESNPIPQFGGRLAEEARDLPLDSVRTDVDPFLMCQSQGHRGDVGTGIHFETGRYIPE